MNYTPKSIELLFNNFKLDVAKALVIIYVISDRRKRIKIQEYIFYELQNCLKLNDVSKDILEVRYMYFKIIGQISKLILYLNDVECILVSNKDTTDILNLDISITDKGRKIVSSLNGDYYKKLFDDIVSIKSEIKYSKTEYKKILEVINEWHKDK